MNIDRYPLTWPAGYPRTDSRSRSDANFRVEFARARDELLRSLELLGGRGVIISSNLALRLDGLPYAKLAEPRDPGVAVYFDRRIKGERRPFVIAADSFRKTKWNLRAIGATVDSLRQMQRHGTSELMERAFTGFQALPPAAKDRPWWDVLGVERTASWPDIRARYHELTKKHHPDVGGDHATFTAITLAYAAATKERNGST